MVYFQNKNPNLGKFLRALGWKMLEYLMPILEYIMAIWYILWSFDNFVVVSYFFPFLVYCVKKNLAALLKVRS
jgi:hypothetical protein